MQCYCPCWIRAKDFVYVELKGNGPVKSESIEVGKEMKELSFGIRNLSQSASVTYWVYREPLIEIEKGMIVPDAKHGIRPINHLIPTPWPGKYFVQLICAGPGECHAEASLQIPPSPPWATWFLEW